MKCDTDINNLKRGKTSICLDIPSLVSHSFCAGSNGHSYELSEPLPVK